MCCFIDSSYWKYLIEFDMDANPWQLNIYFETAILVYNVFVRIIVKNRYWKWIMRPEISFLPCIISHYRTTFTFFRYSGCWEVIISWGCLPRVRSMLPWWGPPMWRLALRIVHPLSRLVEGGFRWSPVAILGSPPRNCSRSSLRMEKGRTLLFMLLSVVRGHHTDGRG